MFFHPQLCQNSVTSIPTGKFFLVGGSYFLHTSIISSNCGTKMFFLEPLWYWLHRQKRPSYQRTRVIQILCQLQLVFLDNSGLSVQNLWSLWGTKLAAGVWRPIAKAPLPKVWQRNTNFSNMFSCLFDLKPLAHFEMLHLQHWNKLLTHCVGRAEDGPRGLVWKRLFFWKNLAGQYHFYKTKKDYC